MRAARKPPGAEETAVDLAVLADIVERFQRQTIVVLGDFVVDEFQAGEITRVSREAPVLILRHRETQLLPGGGANAANNLAFLGTRVLPVAAVGDDAAGRSLVEYFRRKGVDTSAVVVARGWTTPVKTRFLAGWAHTRRQQVLRVDREPETPLPEKVKAALRRKLRERLNRGTAMLVSDYGFGVAGPALVREVTARDRKDKFLVTLDSRYALPAYAGAGLAAATPNEEELESAHHTRIGSKREELERCGRATLEDMKLRSLLVTRGKDGMALFEPGKATAMIPIYGSDQAVDVTGAGDTVIAAYTLALAAGASALEAAHIANFAGSIVVMKRGTATATAAELRAAIRTEATGGAEASG